MFTPEMQEKIQCWQTKLAEGTLTKEELKEALKLLRSQRDKDFSYDAKVTTRRAATPKEAKPSVNQQAEAKALFSSLFGAKPNEGKTEQAAQAPQAPETGGQAPV